MSSNSPSFTLSLPNGSKVAYDNGTGKVSAPSQSTKAMVDGTGVKVEQTNSASVATSDKHLTFKVQTGVKVTVSAASKTPPLAYGLSLSGEIEGTTSGSYAYSVAVPKMEPAAARTVVSNLNPLAPETWPKGVIVTRAQSQGESGKVQLGISRGAVGINCAGSQEITNGSSMAVESLGGGVIKVTTGSSSLVQNSAALGVDVGKYLKASASSGVQLSGETARTVTLDLNTPAGQAAWKQIQQTGTFPEKEQPGVSDLRFTKTFDKARASSWEVELLSLKMGKDSDPQSFRNAVSTYDAKTGLTSYDQTINYPGMPVLTVHREFDANKNERLDKRSYQFDIKIQDQDDINKLRQLSFAKGIDFDKLKPGSTVSIRMSEQDMEKLMAMQALGEDKLRAAHPNAHHNITFMHANDYGVSSRWDTVSNSSPTNRAALALAFADALARGGMVGGNWKDSSGQQVKGIDILHAIADLNAGGVANKAAAPNVQAGLGDQQFAELPGSASVGPRR